MHIPDKFGVKRGAPPLPVAASTRAMRAQRRAEKRRYVSGKRRCVAGIEKPADLRRFSSATRAHPQSSPAKRQVSEIAFRGLPTLKRKTCANEGKTKKGRNAAYSTAPRPPAATLLEDLRARRSSAPSPDLSEARLPAGSASRVRRRAPAAPPRRSTRLCPGAPRSARCPRSSPRPDRKARW